MNTPICDFLENYIEKDPLRLHMPGHKGLGGYEKDITEVDGADSLYGASGIIRKSEENASLLFGCDTFYSTEGSSHCIRAMLCLFRLHCEEKGIKPHMLATRNAHKTFTTAAALLDVSVSFLYPREGESYLSCTPDIAELSERLSAEDFGAVYLTSPDYLGVMADITAISRLCRERGVLLFVDNAHGAYLRFLSPSLHPMDLGADVVCDSAHKTLPCLTGSAYLHIGKDAPRLFSEAAKEALSLFGSTSPSYLLLESLDRVNPYLETEYKGLLARFVKKAEETKICLLKAGYTFMGNEPLKFTIHAKKYGYYGQEIAEILKRQNIICEFYDRDYLVLMLTPEIGEEGLGKLCRGLLSIPKKAEITEMPPAFQKSERVITPHEALFLPREKVDINESCGRVLGEASVGCPPAVPILMCGERITAETIRAFAYYGIKKVSVIKEL